jgi:hypothetical protein
VRSLSYSSHKTPESNKSVPEKRAFRFLRDFIIR